MKKLNIALVAVGVFALVWFTLQPRFNTWLYQDAGFGTGERTAKLAATFERISREQEARMAKYEADAAKLSADYDNKIRQIELELTVFKRQEQERAENEHAQIEAERAEALARLDENK